MSERMTPDEAWTLISLGLLVGVVFSGAMALGLWLEGIFK